MRSIFLYEFLTGGGCWNLGDKPPSGSLLAEGTAMRDALATDLAAIESIKEVRLFHDVRLARPELPKQRLYETKGTADPFVELMEPMEVCELALVIAPEFRLITLTPFVELHCEIISPNSTVVKLCSNKWKTCEHLKARGISAPRGITFEKIPRDLDSAIFPAVLKPNDGCGSQGVQVIETFEELAAVDLTQESPWRLERYHPGIHVSVSVLTGPQGVIPLQPCTQRLSDDGRFQYRGGSTPIPEHYAQRAKRLANAAAETLLPCRGYLGIDMVLGSAEDGSQDVVIEINPRLTTSYLVLRQACEQNLAEAMLQWAAGEPVELTWRPQHFEFAVPAPAHRP